MVSLQSITQYLLLFVIFFGQLGRISLFDLNFPIIDLVLVVFVISLIWSNRRQTSFPAHTKPFLMFIVYSWINLLIKCAYYNFNPLTPSLYLVRLTALLLLFIYPFQISPKFRHAMIIAMSASILFGLFQYLFWPDLTYLKAVGWDDHLNRLVGTYFDPTFTGLIYLMFLFWTASHKQFWLSALSFFAITLTYSRSTFLSIMASAVYFSFTTKKYLYTIVIIITVVVTIFALPRKAGEGTKLERVSSIYAKQVNFQEGLKLFQDHPLTGIGYNNISYYKLSPKGSHSLGGYDASLLNIAITNGLFGLIFFCWGYFLLFRHSPLVARVIIISLLVHSLFANSLFYPYSTVLLALIYHSEQPSRYRKSPQPSS